jgi:VWFA-related protein
MRWKCLLALVAWLLWAGIARADGDFTAELAQIDTSKYPDITLYVSVRDRDGQIVGGLPEEAFKVTEDGAAVDIIAFTAGILSPISTVLTIDRSGSMNEENKMAGARSAATTFVELMRQHDKAALVIFNEAVMTIQPFTSDQAALKRQIQSVYPEGCTAWYDGVYHSVNLIATLEGRRSVILLSDGIDCREDWKYRLLGQGSSYTLDEAIQHARDAGIPVYTIGFGQRATQEVSGEGFDEVKLRRMASETGGQYHHAPDTDELKRLYQSLSVEMQKEYVLTYRSPRPTYDGTRRNIVVTIQQSGGGPGVTTGGKYLEQHLINIRSDLRLFLALLLPLLFLLALPTAASRMGKGRFAKYGRFASRPSQPVIEPAGRDGQAPAVQHLDRLDVPPGLVEPPVMAVPLEPMPPAQLVGRFPLLPEETNIGQAPDNHVVIKHPAVDPHHARIFRQNERYVVHAVGAGQTFVSYSGDPAQERLITQNALKDGSSVRFGDVRCTVRISPDGSAGHIEVPFSLQDTVTTIGRDDANDIVVNAPAVASRQAEIHWEDGRFVVNTLGGNGNLFVSFSGDPSQERPVLGRNALKVGSTLRVGDVVFRLEE